MNIFTLFNQLTAMPKRLAMVLTVLFTLGVESMLGTSYISYNGSTQDESTTISSTNVSNGSAGAISWTGTNCTYSDKRVNISANGSITFSVSGENMITEIVVTSGSTSSYYGTWTSTSGSVSSSSGTTTISDINAASVTIKTSTAFRCTSASSIKIYYDAASSGGAGDDCNVTYDFTKINGFSSWGNSYTTHTVSYEDATVTFKAASKQTGTITDQPVTKGSEVSLVMTDGSTLSSVTWVCKQWTTKAQTITLHYSTNGGTSYTTTGVTSTNFTISKDNLPAGTNAVKITFSSSSNQVGISSCSIEKVCTTETAITLNPNGGTISANGWTYENGVYKLTTEDESITLPEITRTGYTFAGWAKSSNGEIEHNDKAELTELDGTPVVLYAQWTANSYTVIFNANGGTGEMDNQSFNYDEEKALSANEFTRKGHTFVNWNNKDNGSGDDFDDGEEVKNLSTKNGDTYNLYAQWSGVVPVITTHPSSASYFLGEASQSLSIEASAEDATLAYQWQSSLNNEDWYDVQNETNSTYLPSTEIIGTTYYRVVVSNTDADNCNATSNVAVIIIRTSNCRWVEANLSNLESDADVVLTMNDPNGTFAMSNAEGTGAAPKAVEVSVLNSLLENQPSGEIIWTLEKDNEGKLIFHPKNNATSNLYCNTAQNNNDRVRVGTLNNAKINHKFEVDGNILKNSITSHYIGVYYNNGAAQDWRGYANTSYFANQNLKVYTSDCLESDEYWMNYNLSNVICAQPSPLKTKISVEEEGCELEFSANSGYQLPTEISVQMGNRELVLDDEYLWENGYLLILPNVDITGDITINISGCPLLETPVKNDPILTSTSATFSWVSVANAEKYEVTISDNNPSTEDIVRTTTETEITLDGLTKNTTYKWDIKPIAEDFCSNYSQEWVEFTTLDQFTVTFNANGHGTAPATQTVDAGSKITAPANPSAAGYTFNYWYTTDANVPFDFNTPITGNTILNAKWTPNVYTITFYKQSGTGGTDNATVTFNSNNYSVSTIEAPTRDKYAFGGYYTEQHGAGIQVVNADGNWLKNVAGYTDANGNWIKAENTHLYAKWTAIYTITWVVNNNTETPYHTSTVLSGSTIDQLPTPPANDLFADCDVNAFVGWSTDNIGFDPDPTAPTDLFKTVAEAQNKIGAISVDKKFYAVYASEIEQIATFEADGLNGLSANSTLKWTHDNSGISLAISAGQRYTGSPKTFTITNGTNNYCEIVAPEGKSLKKAVVSITGSNYKVNSVSSPWSLSTSNTTQTITTSTNATDLKMYATSSYQIRITQVDVTYTTYSNYITRCTALPDPVWGGATIDKTEIAVNCGETSSTNGAAKISFLKATNYNLYKDIAVEVTSGNFIIATSRDGEYSPSVTLTPTQSGTNVGTLDGKYVYVRAVAPAMSDEDFTGTITISGKQIATQTITVTADVTCTQYTLTFYDQGQTKTVEGFAGTSVVAPEPWAGICTEPIQYVFDGWAETPVANGTEEYDKINFSTYTMPNNNTTVFYAVYRYAEEGGEPVNGYVKVTEALSDWTGDYVIVDNEYNVAIKNAYKENTTSNKTLAIEEVTIESEKVVSPSANVIWALDKNGENYTMYNEVIKKYAGVSGSGTEKAILSADKHDIQIIFDSKTKIAKVYSVSASRCFEYYVANEEWRTYSSTDTRYNTGYLYRFSEKTLRYTSSLICGEISVEEDNVVVTSTKDQTVKVYVPITLGYSDAASITGTSDNEAFSVVTKNDVAVGESTIEVHYKPTAYVNTANQEETATITLTTSNGATTTFNITGRCLPETFAIVAKVGNVWYALPSQGLNSTTPPAAYPVEVDDIADPTAVTAVPANADWSLRQVYASSGANDRFAAHGENLVFVNNASPAMALNASQTGNYLLTGAQYTNYYQTNPGLYEWTPTTTDLETYTLTNAQRTDRTLNVATNTVFGVHYDNKATTEVRFLPITGRYTPMAAQVVEWKDNSVVIMYNGNPTQTAQTSINGTNVGSVTLANVQKDIAVYELPADGLGTKPNQTLSVTIGSEKLLLPTPYMVNSEVTDDVLLGSSLNVQARRDIAKVSNLVILKGGKLTSIGAKTNPYTFRNVTIYGGGTLVVSADKGFGANTLTMRVGGVENGQYKNLYPQLQLKGTLSNTSGQINLDYLTTNEFYYPLSVPYPVTIADIQYPVEIYGANVKSNNTGSFQFKYYDGAERAAGRTGWIVLDESQNSTLNPNTGYAIWGIPNKINGTRQKFGIHRLLLKQTAADMMISEKASHEATVKVYNGSKRESDNGWNYLGNPFLSHYGDFTTADNVMKLGKLVWDEAQSAWLPTDTEQRYVVFTNDCQNYIAELASTTAIPAFSAFFIQADQGGAINFTSPNVATPQSLAARHSEEETKEITTGIILSGEKHSDRTGLLIADQFTQAYEFNADLSKFDNQDMNLYTISSSGKLAFMAINEDLAKQTIPLGYSVSTDGMYTIAFDEQRYSRNDIYALYLIDYDRNETTNLLHMDYNFYSETGAHAERFALQVAFAPNTSTDVEYTQVGDILVSREGNTLRLDNLPSDATVTVYDAVGHLIEQHTASQLLQLTLQKGYYLLHIGNNQHSVVMDTFIP